MRVIAEADHRVLFVPDPDAMDRLGVGLAGALRAGDLVALSGPMGAGKSHLARAAIRAMLGDPMAEVPSPTFTLVNTYVSPKTEIWHADLYRLGDSSELLELGLDDIRHAITLVEWPERWPGLPPRRLDVEIMPEGDGRRIRIRPSGTGWEQAMDALTTLG